MNCPRKILFFNNLDFSQSIQGEFVLSAIAYVIATTNLLNLPKLILENGGLAFLAAYATSIFVVVFPTIILEMSVGQMTGRAPPLAFYNISPVFKGINQLLIFDL